MPLQPISSEEARRRSELAVAARRARSTSLRHDFHSDDERTWQELADAAGVKLPAYGQPLTTAAMERYLKALGIPLEAYLKWGGAGLNGKEESARLSDFIKRNPTWPLKAWVGLILEGRERMLRPAQ